MIKIELSECCYECDRFSIDVNESVFRSRCEDVRRVAIVKCTKSDVCGRICSGGFRSKSNRSPQRDVLH